MKQDQYFIPRQSTLTIRVFMTALSLCFSSIYLLAQVNIEGAVFFNEKPKKNVTVFVNNTSIGTITNDDGEFNLTLDNGVHQIIISHIGFTTIEYYVNTETYTNPLSIALSEEQFVLDELVVRNQNSDNWKNNYYVFIREFIGSGHFAENCTITNPEVLTFDYDGESKALIAEAKEMLIIENQSLGYEIIYDLAHFSVENNTTWYSGYAYFKELEGRKKRIKKWQKNREIAYKGSKIHFYKSILNNTSQEEGFVIDKFKREENPDRPSQEEIQKARKNLKSSKVTLNFSNKKDSQLNDSDSALSIIRKSRLPKYVDYLYASDINPSSMISESNGKTYLKFDDNLRVTYLRENEEEGFLLQTSRNEASHKVSPQSSNLIPLTNKFELYPEGILDKPLDVLYEKYWTYEKFAYSLPLDYEPQQD